uniref:Polyribonucleotide nucleotidyltransferase n=1 Tax=candidate division WOR-3 bacterium TaxID=2052148 RepID=A0A7C4U8E6_UNCW3
MLQVFEIEIGKRKLIIESGDIARQSNGSVIVKYGDTIVLTTACAEKEPKEDIDFFPLTVNYIERTYAAGKIPGGFFKREGKPSDREVLFSRITDRPIRPMFPENFFNETQIITTLLSHDQENESDILSIIGASAALSISDIPFLEPVGAVKIGYKNNEFIVNPTTKEIEDSEMEFVVAGTKNAITMLEGKFSEIDEDVIITAIEIAHREIQKIVELQNRMILSVGKKKMKVEEVIIPEDLKTQVINDVRNEIEISLTIKEKLERKNFYESIVKKEVEKFPDEQRKIVKKIIEDYRTSRFRENVINNEKRIDGRRPDEIRPILCEVGVLPRVHGSALFRRGETVSLCTVTLGTKEDEQKVDELFLEGYKRFMLHYNFPPFSVGEVSPLKAPGRREIGHGALAEKALSFVIPDEKNFPYTIRVVSDILESNGSSSMATVCGSSLALMDAGVPIKSHVGGISIGLIKEGDKYRILTDIAGEEDSHGDMDFKIAGTLKGITAIQLDTKITDLNIQILKEALNYGKEARKKIIDIMTKTLSSPREQISEYAPKIIVMNVPKEKIGEIIGPGGKVIRGIIEKSNAKIEISDDGEVVISSQELSAVEKAKEMIDEIVEEIAVGNVYKGVVTRIAPYGAFVKIGSSKEGLIHISQLAPFKVEKVEDIVKIGEEVRVKVVSIDNQGRIALSRKALLVEEKKGKNHQD